MAAAVAPLPLDELPIVDLSALAALPLDALPNSSSALEAAATAVGRACLRLGFFYVRGHGVPSTLTARVEAAAREFFALPEAEKERVNMALGGPAWRGFFGVGGELTSGRPDVKEGLYFGTELDPGDERVKTGRPTHGPNLWPERPVELRMLVEQWQAEMTRVAMLLIACISHSLGLPAEALGESLMFAHDPVALFRIFHYPVPEIAEPQLAMRQFQGGAAVDMYAGSSASHLAAAPKEGTTQPLWGVGEHTDYGVLTVLYQDPCGGLEVLTRDGRWIEAPPLPDTFVINIGDMLERLTSGLYRSTPHRVRQSLSKNRISTPFFFDPSWDATIRPVPVDRTALEARYGPDLVERAFNDRRKAEERWDAANPHTFQGTYGEYLMRKVAKVFPDLARTQLAVDA